MQTDVAQAGMACYPISRDCEAAMQRIRITSVCNGDPSEELRRLATVRRDLYAHSAVEIDPDNPAYQTRRDDQSRAYFEFSTEFIFEVERVLRDYGHQDKVTVEMVAGPVGDPCLRCGYIAGDQTPSVCPNCGLREISPCPKCGKEVSRQAYVPVAGDLFRCPHCGTRVRLHYNEPQFLSDGSYHEPVIVVEQAIQQPA
jgi:hypothetical protein